MSKSAYYLKIEEKVNELCANSKFVDAYKYCVQAIRENPMDKDLKKLQRRVAKDIENENQRVIDSKLKEVKKFWREEKFKEVIVRLKPLLKIAPRNKKLIKNLKKAQDLYKQKIQETEKKFFEKFESKFEELLKNNHDQLLDELFNLEKKNPGNKRILTFTKNYRDRIIQKEIEEQHQVLESEKYEVIRKLIKRFKFIDKTNARIKVIEDRIKRKQFGLQLEEKEEFVYKGIHHLDVLMKLKKYDKAIIVAEEIIELDKNNEEVAKILKTAQNKFYSQTKNEVTDLIIEDLKKLKQEYKNNKSKFIKI